LSKQHFFLSNQILSQALSIIKHHPTKKYSSRGGIEKRMVGQKTHVVVTKRVLTSTSLAAGREIRGWRGLSM
jgi:hypothetical protein